MNTKIALALTISIMFCSTLQIFHQTALQPVGGVNVSEPKTIQPISQKQFATVKSIAPIIINGNVESFRPLLAKYDWNTDIMLRIMDCESKGNPLIVNNNPATGDYSVGLFQINLYGAMAKTRPSEAWLKDPINNIQYAYSLYKSQGYEAWTCY